MNWSWIPNAITLARVLASLPLLWLLMQRTVRAAPSGWRGGRDLRRTRRHHRQGLRLAVALGGVLDPIADKLLLSVCFFGLWWSLHLPHLAGGGGARPRRW